jgi:hypothetical protein
VQRPYGDAWNRVALILMRPEHSVEFIVWGGSGGWIYLNSTPFEGKTIEEQKALLAWEWRTQ